jgi:hypothetical protein
MNQDFNQALARLLRDIHDRREKSWQSERAAHGTVGRYAKSYHQCYGEAGIAGDNPFHRILDCLFTSGFVDMWDFCDEVLGAPKAEGEQ